MNEIWQRIARTLITLALVGCALIATHYLWKHFKVDPWTRDGRVRADTAQLAPDVSGLVTEVLVKDNQFVKRGDLLFVIDRKRAALAREQAAAKLDQLDRQLRQARKEYQRNSRLGELVSNEAREQSLVSAESLEARQREAKAALSTAELNLTRTEVRAPIDGVIANLELLPGDYATAGHPLFALISSASLRVEGYFEETKIGRIRVGDPVEVILMGDSRIIRGHVESIAGGIEDRDNATSARLLPNVNPTFNWVRLAQRIPVRVKLDELPADLRLVAGRTATVRVIEQSKRDGQP